MPEKEHGIGQDKELKFIEEENIREMGAKRFYWVLKTAVEAFYYHFLHDKDTRQVWNKTRAITHWNITETRTRYRRFKSGKSRMTSLQYRE